MLGVEKEGEVDLFEERCAAIATEVFERHQEFYDAVDELLELVPADRLDVISIVLGWRFIHLQKVVHDAMQLEQQRHLDAVQCVACTTSFMSKMAGNGGWETFPWTSQAGGKERDKVVLSRCLLLLSVAVDRERSGGWFISWTSTWANLLNALRSIAYLSNACC